jgi:aldehyde:ferredoxin oxidoreductase
MKSGRTGPTEKVGKILRVDLSNGRSDTESIGDETMRTFLGGIGIASKILYEETGPQVDPLSPANVVIVSAGLLDGTGATTANRTEVTTKSPLTGIIGSGNTGGPFGARLRKAGYETLVVKGRSEGPVYVLIDDDRVEIKEASHLWGKDTREATAAIKKEIGDDFSVMAIGQAGENLVRFACPVFDCYHAPGRCHAGCVMGSKNLKAVAVRGTREIRVAQQEKFQVLCEAIKERIRNYPEKGLKDKIGSLGKQASRRGGFGARHFQVGTLPDSHDLWRPETFLQYLVPGPSYCGDCPLSHIWGCNATAVVKEGKYKGMYMEGIAFSNTVANWGSKCGIESFPDMMKCKEVCNRYGMDMDNPIPFALELFQRGILTREDFDGKEFNWGDGDAIIDMLGKIARREGLGDILAEGSVRAAKIIGRGAENYVLAVKGMELLPGEDPRAMGISTSFGHLTCARGGDDLKNTHAIVENLPGWAGKQGMNEEVYTKWHVNHLDMFDEVKEIIYGTPPKMNHPGRSPESIVWQNKWYEDLSAIRDSLGVCLFATNTTNTIGIDYCTKLYSAYLGLDVSPREMMRAGERIVNLMKAYNVREGLTREDDHYPPRFYNEPVNASGEGSADGPVLSKDFMNRLLSIYYGLRGWDTETGSPTGKTLKELGLDFVAEELEKKQLIK